MPHCAPHPGLSLTVVWLWCPEVTHVDRFDLLKTDEETARPFAHHFYSLITEAEARTSPAEIDLLSGECFVLFFPFFWSCRNLKRNSDLEN